MASITAEAFGLSKYAIKFVNDSGGNIPTDAALAEVLAGCTRPPQPDEFPAIRQHVYSYLEGREHRGRKARAALLDRAESCSRDARRFADMARLGQVTDELTEEDCKRYAAMYRTIAGELRKVAASL